MSTFSCEYEHVFITDGLYNTIKNILTFQLSFGNQKTPKEATARRKKLTRRKSVAAYNMLTVIRLEDN